MHLTWVSIKWVNVYGCARVAFVTGLAWAAVGCGSSRVVSISTTPGDAMLRIDDVETVRAPAVEKLQFANHEPHKVLASRFGYTDQQRVLAEDPQTGNLIATYTDADGRDVRETVQDDLRIVLPPKRRKLTFSVTPPGVVTLDGQPLSTGPVSQVTRWVDFTVDADNHWLPHTVIVTRPGFPDVGRSVQWTDQDPVYTLQLDPYRKDLHIVTRPPGAEIFINGEPRGAEPVSIKNFAFPVDLGTGQFIPQKVTAKKLGYDPVERTIGWDNGQTEYTIDLTARTKSIRLVTDPPGGVIKLGDAELPRDASGASTATLPFAPTDDKGTPKVYTVTASKKEGDKEWEAAPFPISWDEGRPAYTIKLAEIKTRPVMMVRPRFVHGDGGWRVTTETIRTVAPRDVSEPGALSVTPLLRLPAGANAAGTIDSLATSPDGSQIVFSVLSAGSGTEPHSQLEILDTDGTADPHQPRLLGDDKSLSLTPSFSPDGKRVLFSSNRDGKRMAIWSVPADGSAAPARLTVGDTNDLWPSLDSLPQPRLFYQSLLDNRPEPRLYVTSIGGAQPTGGTDLAQAGWQPHVSPTADRVLFAAPGTPGPADVIRRRLYTIPDNGGRAVELNHSADFDDFDPAWSKDGSRIAFASNRPRKTQGAEKAGGGAGGAGGVAGVVGAGGPDYNVWILDLAHPDIPVQLTVNGAWDDCPAWDASGKAVYFRSNRGGEWGIWKVSWK